MKEAKINKMAETYSSDSEHQKHFKAGVRHLAEWLLEKYNPTYLEIMSIEYAGRLEADHLEPEPSFCGYEAAFLAGAEEVKRYLKA